MRRLGRTGPGLVARGIWQRRWLSLIAFLTAVLAAAAAAVGPMYGDAARTAIVRNAFTVASADAQGLMVVSNRPSQTPPAFLDELPGATGIPDGFDAPIRGAEINSGIVNQIGQVSLIWRESSCDRLLLVSGRCPSSPGEIVASRGTVSRYDWNIGDQVFLTDLVPPTRLDATEEDEAGPLALTVVGIYEPRDRGDSYWFGIMQISDEAEASASGAAGPIDPLIAEETTVEWAAHADPPWEFSVTLLLDVESLQGNDVESLHAVPTRVREWAAGQADVFTSMKGAAFDAIREQDSLDVSLVVVSLELVGLIWLLLFLAVGDLVRARRDEIALARLRGLTPLQVWRFGLGEPVAMLVLALPVGVLLSVPTVGMLSQVLLVSDIEVSVGRAAWFAASAGVLGGLLAAAFAASSTMTMPVMEQWRNPRLRRERRSWVVEGVVFAIAAAGLLELISGGLITEASDEDVVALLVPALLSIAVALLAARALPHVGRWSSRTAENRRGVGMFLGIRHAARSPDAAGVVIVLTVAFALATFAVAAWAVTARNHRYVATVHNGAPTVLVVNPPEGSRLTELVDHADPSGQSATPVAIYDRTARLLAVDTERFPYVANWLPEFTDVPLNALLPRLRPPSAPPVMLSGDQIRITIDSRRVDTPELELFVDLEVPDQVGAVRMPLEVSGEAAQEALESRLPRSCRQLCELRGVTVITGTDTDGGTSEAELVITKIDVHSEKGWHTVDAGLTETGSWRAEGSSFGIPAQTAETDSGLVLTFETGALTRALVATHPPLLPAVTLGDIGPRPVGQQVGGLDSFIQEVESIAQARALPGATGPTAMVDYTTAEHAAYGLSERLDHQVWVTTEAAAEVKDNLRDQGVVITTERTISDLEQQFNSQGPGLALALLLVMAAVGALLAMARAGISLYASGRQRSYQFAALSAIGASPSDQRTSLLIEQAITLAAGVLAGAFAGILAAAIALRRLPQFSTPPATPPLTYTLDPLVVVGALAVSVLAVAIVVVVTTEGIRRSVRLEQLREAAP